MGTNLIGANILGVESMKKTLSKSMAVLRLVISLIWIALSIFAMFYTHKTVQRAQSWLGETLAPLIESIDNVHAIMVESNDVLVGVEESLDSVQDVTVDMTILLTDTRPLVSESTEVIASDIPGAIEGIQASMPSLIETAATVDETLRFLSNFEASIPIPFRDSLSFGLGIDYDPETPLDQALEDLNGNMDGIPENLRDLEDDLTTANDNLLVVRDDLSALADDLYEINQELKDINPRLEALTEDVQALQSTLTGVEERAVTVLPIARAVTISLLALILLAQLPTIYMALLVLRGEIFSDQA